MGDSIADARLLGLRHRTHSPAGNAHDQLSGGDFFALRHERCGGIAFVERPFMGKLSAFAAFLNVDGGIMFKVFVGRDETRALRADQLARFKALADRIAPVA